MGLFAKTNDTSNKTNQNKEFESLSRLQLFRIMSVLAILFIALFGTIEISIQNYKNIVPEYGTGLILLIGFLLAYRKNCFNLACNISLIGLNFLYVFFLLYGGYGNYGIVWIFPYPLVCFYLKGKQSGIVWIIFYLLVNGFFTILTSLGILSTPYSFPEIFQIFLCFITIALLAYLYEDIKVKREIKLIKQLYQDELTLLPNRKQLLVDIQKSETATLFLINIDNFKEINGFYGATAGDAIIVEMSKRLRSNLPPDKFNIYKLHADEYAVLMKEEQESENELNKLIEYFNTIILKEYHWEDQQIIISITIGNATGRDSLLERTDMALKSAKRNKVNYQLSDKSLEIRKNYGDNLQMVRTLKEAIADGRIILYYQPIINNLSGKIEKYECLVRLAESSGNILLPFAFLPIAKKSKLYPILTKIVIEKSFAAFSHQDYQFSVNLLFEDLVNQQLRDFIRQNLMKYSVQGKVIFEIVESENIENYDEVLGFIKEMKAAGCKIAIDDFGAGYSNFIHVLNLQIDYVKIDSSLIKNIVNDIHSQILTENIVNFSQKLGIKTIAEFVHSQAVLEKVKELKIDYSQGFYLGRPQATIFSDS